MLKELRLSNFKLFKEASIEFGAITVFVGSHGTGKSSILQALQLLKQSAGMEGFNLTGPWIKELQFRDIIHGWNERAVLAMGLRLEFPEPITPISEEPGYEITYDILFDNRGFREHRSVYTFKERQFEFKIPRPPGRWTVPPNFKLADRPSVYFRPSTFTLLPFLAFVDGRDYILLQSWLQLKERIRNYFVSTQVVPAERLITCNSCPDKGSEPQGSLSNVEDVINKLAYRLDVRDDVSLWLRDILERRIVATRVAGAIKIETFDGSQIPILADGAGVRQIIWPLTALATAEPGAMILIEEPEIHLHPAAQARLCELLLKHSQSAEKQLVITTHSEHILMSLLTAVINGHLSPGELAIYLCESEGEEAKIRRLEVDAKGRVKGGLPGFFEASLDELEELLKALSSNPKL